MEARLTLSTMVQVQAMQPTTPQTQAMEARSTPLMMVLPLVHIYFILNIMPFPDSLSADGTADPTTTADDATTSDAATADGTTTADDATTSDGATADGTSTADDAATSDAAADGTDSADAAASSDSASAASSAAAAAPTKPAASSGSTQASSAAAAAKSAAAKALADKAAADKAAAANAAATKAAAAKAAAAKAAAAKAAADKAAAAKAATAQTAAADGSCAGGINTATVSLIKKFEGFVASPAPDPIGLPTVGFGHKCQSAGCAEVPFSFPLSQTTATSLLQTDVKQFVSCVNSAVSNSVTLNDNQVGALTSFSFNVGCGNLKSSTFLKRVNAGEDPNTVAAQELPKFNKAGGKVLAGLTSRRAAEVALFQTASSVKAHPCT
jgi:GH24 family phage-related lysozyme (muramidase)